MKTHQQQRRTTATRSDDAPALPTKPDGVPRGPMKTCKVAVPDVLHAAIKVVAARRGTPEAKRTVQDLVAELLRKDPAIAAEEQSLLEALA